MFQNRIKQNHLGIITSFKLFMINMCPFTRPVGINTTHSENIQIQGMCEEAKRLTGTIRRFFCIIIFAYGI